jgi:hypothetical protein
MLTIVLDLTIRSQRDSKILIESYPGKSLLSYILEIINAEFTRYDLLAVTNKKEIGARLRDQHIPVILRKGSGGGEFVFPWTEIAAFLNANDHLKNLEPECPVVFLSPGVGIVSRHRLAYLHARFQRVNDRVIISASRLPEDCHPSWLRFLPVAYEDKTSFEWDQLPPPLRREVFLKPEIHELFPHIEEIKGSQWLPELFQADAAIVCCHARQVCKGQVFSEKYWAIELCDPEPDLPVWAYALPILKLHAHQPF